MDEAITFKPKQFNYSVLPRLLDTVKELDEDKEYADDGTINPNQNYEIAQICFIPALSSDTKKYVRTIDNDNNVSVIYFTNELQITEENGRYKLLNLKLVNENLTIKFAKDVVYNWVAVS